MVNCVRKATSFFGNFLGRVFVIEVVQIVQSKQKTLLQCLFNVDPNSHTR